MNQPRKYALVTGASSGIGWHISKELSKKGFSIVAVSNQPEQLHNLKEELESTFSINVIALTINLAQPGAAKEVFEYCETNNLEVEVIVNNAGLLVLGEATKVDYSDAFNILQLHIITTALLCHLFGKRMRERKKGYILNVSSISAVMPYPLISFYGPTKTFIRSFTRALRTEMKIYKINVTCLLPGATATALYDKKKINIPLAMKLGIMMKPDKVAKAGVKSLFSGRGESIPGVLNKLIVLSVPIIPHWVIDWINRSRNRKNKN